MKTEVQSLDARIQDTLSGIPWYGKSVLDMLDEIDPSIVYLKPNEQSHSIIELLYHMITWTEFTLKRLEKDRSMDPADLEKLDWRNTDPEIHTWNSGISAFKAAMNKISKILQESTDEILEGKVDYREYNFRYLLNGFIEHNIYHIGQIAYAKRLLS